MRVQRKYLSVALATCMLAASAYAQSVDDEARGGMAPLPDNSLSRITPASPTEDPESIFTTHKPTGTLPWKAPMPAVVPSPVPDAAAQPMPAAPSPFGTVATTPPSPAANPFPGKVPFGHANLPPVIPSAPHATASAPVANVDSVEVSEPAPATEIPPEADPAKEDPANPTELTSPIFDAAADSGAPRKIVLRVLNKVTAQSARLEAKPNELLHFGRLDILPVTCRTSIATSQRDDAGLFDVVEHLPGTPGTIKPIFHGWMYASSPSIAALEHPIYDVTMVACEIAEKPAKPVDKVAKKAK